MSMMNHKVDPLNEERSVIDNLIASSQNLMGSTESPVSQPIPTPSDYQMAAPKSQLMLKSRRGRTSFTPSQLSDLEAAFSNTHYPDFQTRKDLSKRLKIPDDRIQVWFQNRRAKWRKNQRQMNGAIHMTNYHSNNPPTVNTPQNQSPPDILFGYNMVRPSPIRHTTSLVKSEASFSAERCPATQTRATDSKNQQHTYQGQQYQQQQQNPVNMLNIYEKSSIPCTSSKVDIPENQRTAPSLYSLSAAVTSSGQYIILGSHSNPPATYPMAMTSNNYPLHVPGQSQKY